MADAIAVPNGMAQLAQLSQILKGFTGTKQESAGTTDPKALDSLMQIIQQYSPGAARADAEGISTAMLQEAAMKFAPLLGTERAAGARGTSGVRQLGEQAQVAAAGEAARTLLQAMTQYGGIASSAAGNAAGATRGQTTTTKSTVDPTQILTQIGAIMAMQALKKKPATAAKKPNAAAGAVTNKGISALLQGPEAVAAGFDGGVDALLKGVPTATGAFDPSTLSISDLVSGKINLEDFSTALGSVGGDIPYNFLTAPADSADISGGENILSAFGSGSDFLARSAVDWTTSAGIDAATQAAGSAVAEGFVGDAFFDGGVDLLGDAGASLAGDAAFSVGVPYLTIARLGADALGIKEVGQVLDGVSGAVSDVVSGVGDAVGGLFDSIICTWLYKNGLMPRRLYVASAQHFREYAKKGLPVGGYYVWSRPVLKLMQKSRVLVAVMRYVMTHRARYIGWQREMPGVKFSALGAVFAAALFGLSYTLGKLQQLHAPAQVA